MRRVVFIAAFTLLLVAGARAGTPDGNLIEYGMGVATLGHPRGGDDVQLLHLIPAEIPNEYRSFCPKSVTVSLFRGRTWRDPVAWPFPAIRLAAGDGLQNQPQELGTTLEMLRMSAAD